MKKILLLVLALAAILPASADCYLTFGVNDTLKVNPSSEDSIQRVMVRAHFDGRLSEWNMTLSLPQGMRLVGCERREGMLEIGYYNQSGELTYYTAPLYVTNQGATVNLRSNINVPGYWDPNNDGLYENYGTVKWEAGEYDQMFELLFKFEDGFPDISSITVNEYLSCSIDLRGYTIPNTYLDKTIRLLVVYRPGDVDGDGNVSIADVSALVDLVLSGEPSPVEEAMNAADVDGDGKVGIADVTQLIDQLLNETQH